MPHNRFEWIDRLKCVEREHRVVATAIVRLRLAILEGLSAHRTARPSRPGSSGRESRDNVPGAPLGRVRDGASLLLPLPDGRPRGPDQGDRSGQHSGRRSARPGHRRRVRDAVHEVREYRNSLVHERTDPAPPVALVEARSRLNTFLGKLPEQWG